MGYPTSPPSKSLGISMGGGGGWGRRVVGETMIESVATLGLPLDPTSLGLGLVDARKGLGFDVPVKP